jgi:BirA family transcriptional regulator, biotin operon repressor / biotin---[acetyl-CoA-carboxylase] ligase
MEIIRLNETDSTNTYAKKLLAENKITRASCIVTSNQTSGRGMQQNIWESEAYSNLTFSMISFPAFLPAASQFQLNKVVSLSVLDLFKKTLPNDNMSIKWPNDIYIDAKKVGGILIETSIIGQKMNWVVIGIGINVNQKIFSKDLPNAASLIHFSKKEFDLDRLLETYICLFHQRYAQLSANKTKEIDAEYLKALFRFGEPSKFVFRGKEISATITGVNEFGWLQLVTSENKRLECEMKEIAYVI